MFQPISRRAMLLGGLSGVIAGHLAPKSARADAPVSSYAAALEQAKGQTVYFNAWGGDQRINDYIAWAGAELEARFDVTLQHVKLGDTAEAVTRVLAGKIAGQTDGGGVDLIWINGENFATMKAQDLLYGPILQFLPSMHFVDPARKPTVLVDFNVPTDGYESPWGMAQLVFFHDSARLATPPRSLSALLDWAQKNPGRLTYPAPPDFIGSTVMKQLLMMSVSNRAPLARPLESSQFEAVSAPLWDFLDQLTPHLWRGGRSYPINSSALRQLLGDGEIDISMAFNPGDASSAIAQGLLPATVRSFVMDGGSIGNTHFVAIPFNANAKAGAIVTADFLLSPEAQAHKANADIWGDPTVLEMDLLTPDDAARFAALPAGIATLAPEKLGPVLPEPHASWMVAIEQRWVTLYGS